jgi:hypothetical protein
VELLDWLLVVVPGAQVVGANALLFNFAHEIPDSNGKSVED